MSEGAEVLIGGHFTEDQVESMEEMVEAIVALCDCPPERTGRTHVSLDLLAELGLSVHRLDGTAARGLKLASGRQRLQTDLSSGALTGAADRRR